MGERAIKTQIDQERETGENLRERKRERE